MKKVKYNYKISVIVPIYNVGKYLDKTIESVIKQTIGFDNIQLVLINDGSSDNSGDVCLKYKEMYPENVTYINKKNGGVSAARNEGLKSSYGKYILFLDGDDYISLNTCEKLFEFFELHYNEVDVVTYPIMITRKNNIVKHFRYGNLYYKGSGVYDLNKDYYLIQSNVNVIVKNDKNHFFKEELKFVEDEDFVSRIISSKMKIGFVSNCYYYYVKRNDNSNNTIVYDSNEMKKVYENYEKLLKMSKFHKYFQTIFVNALRWRICENKFYCIKDNFDSISKIIYELLLNIDVNIINKFPKIKLFEKISILKLKKCKFNYKINNNKIMIYADGVLIHESNEIDIDIFRMNIDNNTIYISGGFSELYFDFFKNIKLFIECNGEYKELSLKKNLEKSNYYKKLNYFFSFDGKTRKKYSFWVEIDGKRIRTHLNYSKMRSSCFKYVVYKNNVVKNNLILKLKHFIMHSIRCLKVVNNLFDRLKYRLLPRRNICINYTDNDISKFKGCKVISYKDLTNKNEKKLFCSCKYIFINDFNFTNICPFGFIYYKMNDLYSFKSILCYDNRDITYNDFASNYSDYIMVNNQNDVDKVIKKYNYNRKEIFIKK